MRKPFSQFFAPFSVITNFSTKLREAGEILPIFTKLHQIYRVSRSYAEVHLELIAFDISTLQNEM